MLLVLSVQHNGTKEAPSILSKPAPSLHARMALHHSTLWTHAVDPSDGDPGCRLMLIGQANLQLPRFEPATPQGAFEMHLTPMNKQRLTKGTAHGWCTRQPRPMPLKLIFANNSSLKPSGNPVPLSSCLSSCSGHGPLLVLVI